MTEILPILSPTLLTILVSVAAIVVVGIILLLLFRTKNGETTSVALPVIGNFSVTKKGNTKVKPKPKKENTALEQMGIIGMNTDWNEILLIMSRLIKNQRRIGEIEQEYFQRQMRQAEDSVKEAELLTIEFFTKHFPEHYNYLGKLVFISSQKTKERIRKILEENHLSEKEESMTGKDAFIKMKNNLLIHDMLRDLEHNWDGEIFGSDFVKIRTELKAINTAYVLIFTRFLEAAIRLAVEKDEKVKAIKKDFFEDVKLRIPEAPDLASLITDLL